MDFGLSYFGNCFGLDYDMDGDKMNYVEESKKGCLPSVSSIGGYPIFYVTKDSNALCGDCGSKEPENIEIHDIHWEGPSITCQGCNKEIESAYGDPEEE